MLKPSLNLTALAREKADLSRSVGCQPSELRRRPIPSDPPTPESPDLKSSLASRAQHQQALPEEVDWSSYRSYRRAGDIYRRTDNEGPINDTWTQLSFGLDSETGELSVVERAHNFHSDLSHDKRDSLPRRFFGRGRALRDFVAGKDYEITVRRGDEVLILEHPTKSVSKRGIQYEWEGWVKVRLLKSGREGEVPTSQITEVETASNLGRQRIKRCRLQSLDSSLPRPAQLIAGVGHISVSDDTAVARLAQQWVQHVTSRDSPSADHHGLSGRSMSMARPSQRPAWSGGIEPRTLTVAHPSDPGNLQEACAEDPEPRSTSGELRNRVAKRLGCLSRNDAMFVSYTISEDRTGFQGEFMATRLAALGAHCERRDLSVR